ncbi:TonB-dependent receptor [Tenacibaculum haliotis]|uniref:TonB-dependent receptor n=1 Tax=Tenacibaculum haliotis TaxID=1888914 RepID=UPI0021AF279E|nr:TonB-dependent receptor [Tenacibaculum haliotis]MCT4699053.1 TonB-dependent receptor [Tenacibaculum haliotis]
MIKSIKKHLGLLVLFVISIANAQEKKAPEKAKDTIIKTEVVNVVTSYVPKITDAFKIKQKPIIKHTKETQKKELEYTIFSVPVASTFIPKSGVMKKLDLGKKEALYDNYFSLGLGNKISPFLEAHIRRNESYNSEFGAHLKFLLSADPVEKTRLSSTFYDLNLSLFYAQQERYLSWKAGLKAERNKHNWYGLPTNINFTDATVSAIEEEQSYNSFTIFGNIKFEDSYLEEGNAAVSLLTDAMSSSEFLIDGNAKFKFPLNNFHRELNDLYINTTLSYLGTSFENSYNTRSELKHSFFTFGAHPTYNFRVRDLAIKIGAKAYFSLDIQNKNNNFFICPDIEVSYPIVKDFANVFVGVSGDLKTNTYKSLSDKNPYISPTQNILQTNKKYNAFAGIKGRLDSQFSYNFKASYAEIENNPFFALNQSKSDGNNNAGTDAFSFFGYDYGNSFNTEYDDIKLVSFFGEVAFDGIKNLSVGLNGQFNKFTLTNELEPWNTPKIKGELFGTYKTNKWFAGANFFFVGQRKGKLYDTLPLETFSTIDLDDYFDINFNGGYHFNDSFSVFLNLNNVLNNSYQRFNNFNVQGFQAMGGLTWKFDSIF